MTSGIVLFRGGKATLSQSLVWMLLVLLLLLHLLVLELSCEIVTGALAGWEIGHGHDCI